MSCGKPESDRLERCSATSSTAKPNVDFAILLRMGMVAHTPPTESMNMMGHQQNVTFVVLAHMVGAVHIPQRKTTDMEKDQNAAGAGLVL